MPIILHKQKIIPSSITIIVKQIPNNYFGYSQDCWGLTASDIENGYNASSPTNDIGVIAPTAALSSFPYTPAESMTGIKIFLLYTG